MQRDWLIQMNPDFYLPPAPKEPPLHFPVIGPSPFDRKVKETFPDNKNTDRKSSRRLSAGERRPAPKHTSATGALVGPFACSGDQTQEWKPPVQSSSLPLYRARVIGWTRSSRPERRRRPQKVAAATTTSGDIMTKPRMMRAEQLLSSR